MRIDNNQSSANSSRPGTLGNIVKLLNVAKKNEIEIKLYDGDLQIRIQQDKQVPEYLLEEIRKNKALLVDYLGKSDWRSKRVDHNSNKVTRIDRASIEKIPLSFSQERLWFINQFEGSVQYHIPVVLRLKGRLNREALEYAFKNIVLRHEVLRTVVKEEGGLAYQEVREAEQWKLSVIEQTESQKSGDIQRLIEDIIYAPFDLSKDYMLRSTVVGVDKDEHILVITLHHIASDAASKSVLVKEVVELYSCYEEGREMRLAHLPIQYLDYSFWQRNYLEGELLNRKLTYWKQKLDGVTPLQLFTDFRRPSVPTNKGAITIFNIEKELSDELQIFSKQHSVTIFMTLLAALKVILYRHTGQSDICVGSPITNRNQQELEALIGFFVNTIALRTDLNGDDSFAVLLQKVRKTTLEAYANQELPFERVVNAVVKERDVSRTPIFQVLFVLQDKSEMPELRLGELMIITEKYEHTTSKFDLTFTLTRTRTGLSGAVQYSTDLYRKETIDRISGQFVELLKNIVRSPEQKIGRLPILSKAEEQKLLIEFNSTTVEYQKNRNIVDLFEEQVLRAPGAVALYFQDHNLTFLELNERSNQLAHYLKSVGVGPETLVPLCIERGLGMVIAILGILKSGSAYVPVDPEYPLDRIRLILEDTAAKLIVTTQQSRSKLVALEGLDIIQVDLESPVIRAQAIINLHETIHPYNLAYVIYTSGSTGKPKGVMIEHKNVYSFICWATDEFSPGSFDILYASTSICFDLSVYEILYPLLVGKPVRVLENGLQISDYLNRDKNVLVNTVPVVIDHLLKEGTDLVNVTLINMAGEPVPEHVRDGLDTARIEVRNLYGPTESTTYSTVFRIRKRQPILIGKPISNTNIHIISNYSELVPIGVAGEMCIAGAGLARGYLNREELTLEKFVPDPFSGKAGSKMYRTGDIGRWLADGSLEYLGRKDEQVKIRGYRIEPGEIESVIMQSGLVKQTVVVVREDNNGNKRLIGYIVAKEASAGQAIALHLQARLPAFMIPSLWVELQSLPLTLNGKVDKKALPEPQDTIIIDQGFIAPLSELEKKLASIWQEVLGLKQVGINDNFFELGGDSIITIQVVSRARRLGVELQPKDIFIYQTIGKLSGAIAERTESISNGEQGVLTGASGLLPIQQWYFINNCNDVSYYNQSILVSIKKSVTEPVLRSAFEQIIFRHDALRFKYNRSSESWQQEYGTITEELVTLDLRFVSIENLPGLVSEHANLYQSSLNIEKGNLWQAVWIQTPETDLNNRLFIVVHHLAVDGVSWRILLEDLEVLLTSLMDNTNANLGPKSSSYRQWYNALHEYGQSQRLQKQISYWERVVASYAKLPTDKTWGEKIRIQDNLQYTNHLNAEKTQALLQGVPEVYHTHINDLLLAALAATLGEWSGLDRVVIGLEGHGREHIQDGIDISRTVGWFTNLYPIALRVNSGLDELIKQTKEHLRLIPDKGLGYGVLKYINKAKTLQGPEPYDIIFNYRGQFDNVVRESKWFTGAPESTGTSRSGNQTIGEKLSINSFVQGGKLVVRWTYSSKHYWQDSVKNLAELYLSKLDSIIDHCKHLQEASVKVFTPSDFGLAPEIGYTEFDKFFTEVYKDGQRKDYIKSVYRLSGLQQGMLFHSLYNGQEGGSAYVKQFACDVLGVDIDILRCSWDKMFEKHSILRTGFYYDIFDLPVQCVFQNVELPVKILDFTTMTEVEQAQRLEDYQDSDRLKAFNLEEPPLMRLTLIKLSDKRHRMLWTLHHILLDGWSMPILMEEFLGVYRSLLEGNNVVISQEDLYEDYIRYVERQDKEREEKHWCNYLNGVKQGTLLPFINNTSERNKGKGVYEYLSLQINPALTAKVQAYAYQNRLTINTIMQGVWSRLLHCYTNGKDILYGVVVSGRPDDLPGVEKRIGLYINTLPLRSQYRQKEKIVDWLQRLQEEQVSSRLYQYTPLHQIQKWAGIQGDLFDSLLVFENYPVNRIKSSKESSLQVRDVHINEQSNYPLTIIINSSDHINIRFSYNTTLLEKEYIQEVRDHFEQVLLELIEGQKPTLEDISIITVRERFQLLETFNNTAVEYCKNKNVLDLFEEQVALNAGSVAVMFEGASLSYSELNLKANQLAYFLRDKGVKEETIVPICLDRSFELIIAMLGILKAGGAYLPVDPGYPAERISYMLQDSAASMVITHITYLERLAFVKDIEVIELNKLPEIAREVSTNLKVAIKSDNLAYVIYTSGSTGTPKGVMIEHGGLANLINWHKKEYKVCNSSRATVMAGVGFDALGWEIWPYLSSGASIYIINDQSRLSPGLLIEKFNLYGITHSFVSTALVSDCIDASRNKINSLKYLLTGGDKLTSVNLENINYVVVNNYGPTENTVVTTSYRLPSNSRVSVPYIGMPISNTRIYILNSNLSMVPLGVVGEICVAGDGLARGYLNREELTAEKFVKDPFSKVDNARIYKTGDLGRWLPNGNLDYIGRLDNQVKIRGYRIELGEIENVLVRSGLVKRAVILAKEGRDGNRRLVGYVVMDEFDKDKLIAYLQTKLPSYMVPSIFLELTSIPLTPNGKVDLKSLPEPETESILRTESSAPLNKTQAEFVEIWKEVLKVQQISVHDDFFELGGHSLLAMQLTVAVSKRLGIQLRMEDIFTHPTAHKLMEYMQLGSINLEEPSITSNSLIQIKPGGKNVPLYIVSGGAGTVFTFKKFADLLDPEQAVYGLQQPTSLEDIERFPKTVEGIAAKYVEEILLQNPTGPYALSGHCVGGIIAFEMSKQLEAMGKKVKLLAMFDTVVREKTKSQPQTIGNLFHIPVALKRSITRFLSKIHFETFLLTKHTKYAFNYRIGRLKSIRNSVSGDMEVKEGFDIFKKLEDNFKAASLNYSMSPYNGEILVFYAQEHYVFWDKDNNVSYKKYYLSDKVKNVWNQYASSTTVYEIEGEHSTIFYSDNAKKFAGLLQAHLNNNS